VYDGGLSSFFYYYVQMIEPFMSYHIMHSLFRRRVHHVYAAPIRYLPLQHNQSDSAHVFRTRLVPRINATSDGGRAVVVEVVVQRSVACAKLLIFEEERVIEEKPAWSRQLVTWSRYRWMLDVLTLFDKINASFISAFSRVLSFASSFSNATSVA
jgi:hypothetical protein